MADVGHLGYHAQRVVAHVLREMLPFEKRYYSGGANSVRGWSVRDLGPGSFPGDNNFMNQSGDIKLCRAAACDKGKVFTSLYALKELVGFFKHGKYGFFGGSIPFFIRIRRSSIISFCKGWHTGTDPYTVSCTTDNEDSDNFFHQ